MNYHPCSKEFQEEAKKLGLAGNQYIQKLREEEKLVDPIKIHIDKQGLATINKYKDFKEYRDLFAKKRGFDCYKEYRDKDWRYNTLRSRSMTENEEYASYFGAYIAERYIRELLSGRKDRISPNQCMYG